MWPNLLDAIVLVLVYIGKTRLIEANISKSKEQATS